MRRALFMLLFLLPAAGLAQPGRFELTPFAGYRLDGDFNAESSDAFDPDLNVEIEEGAVFGILFDIPLTPNWQLELLANRQESSFIVDPGLFEPESELGDVTLTYLHAGILLQWGLGQVNPFVTASAGLARIDPELAAVDADNRLSASFGGGVKVFFADNVGLRLEARGYWTDLDTEFEDRRSRYDSGDGLTQGEASVGLIVAF